MTTNNVSKKQQAVQIMIADSDPVFASRLANVINEKSPYELAGVVYDGLTLTRAVRDRQPDIVIIDPMLPKLDGLSAMDIIRDDAFLPRKPHFLACTYAKDPMTLARLAGHQCYTLIKPMTPEGVLKSIRQMAHTYEGHDEEILSSGRKVSSVSESKGDVWPPEKKPFDAEDRIVEVLGKLGVPKRLRGYPYLVQGVMLAFEDREALLRMGDKIYVPLGREAGTSGSQVERSMRNVLEKTWQEGNHDYQHELFGSISTRTGKPCNSEFLATVSDLVRREYKKSLSNC